MDIETFSKLKEELIQIAFSNGEYRTGMLNSTKGKIFKEKISGTSFNGYSSLQEKISALRGNLFSPALCHCGKVLKLNSNGKFQKNCSSKCAGSSPLTSERRTRTNIEKYGTQFSAGSPEVQDKIKRTMVNRYGVTSSLSDLRTKEKIQRTNLEKYGNVNPAKADLIRHRISESLTNRPTNEKIKTRLKTKDTNIQRYGVDHPSKVEGARKQSSSNTLKRFEESSLDIFLKNLYDDQKITPSEKIEKWGGFDIPLKWDHEKCGKSFVAIPRSTRSIQCPFCRSKSKVQQDIEQILSDASISFIVEDRKQIHPYEIDVYIPDYNIGIEVNGIFWHHDQTKQLPLLQKSEMAAKKNIQVLHFWDFEIQNSPEIVKNIILSKLGKLPKVGARKLEVVQVDKDQADIFFKKYHLQGSAQHQFAIGLKNGEDLVQVLSFSKSRFNGADKLEIIRFASAPMSIQGGLSKILKALKTRYTGPLITFADRRISDGGGYLKVGFALVSETKPNFFYWKGNTKLTRYKVMKNNLKNILDNFDESLSADILLKREGYFRCFDCGNLKFEITI
jgi:hypothetical protein